VAGPIDYEAIALRLSRVFRPGTPIEQMDVFFGRLAEIRQVVDAINQAGQHVIIYGETGVGKTSLAQILKEKLRGVEDVPIIAPLINCDSGDSYPSIWSKVAEFIPNDPQRDATEDVEPEDAETNEQSLMAATPQDVRRFFQGVGTKGLVYVILDEFDKLSNPAARALVADTIKLLSDRAVPVTLILVGVSDDVTGLINDHRSIERCLTQIHLGRLAIAELSLIVKRGLAVVGMTIDDIALSEITGLSKGLPHYTHLLSLHACRAALDQMSMNVTIEHVQKAIKSALKSSQESICRDYDKATFSTKKNTLHERVLLACAMAVPDEFGRFQPTDVCEPMRKITGQEFTTDRFSRHLHQFCDDDHGQVLKHIGEEYRWKYRFRNPLMQPYLLMRGLDSGAITEKDLQLDVDLNCQRRLKLPPT
jgi:Cdc6-like AAA superfamily ATPase